MFDKIKSLLADWRVNVALVGGAIVVATTLGTCTFEPTGDDVDADEVENVDEVEVPAAVGEESSTETTETTETENTNEGNTTTE